MQEKAPLGKRGHGAVLQEGIAGVDEGIEILQLRQRLEKKGSKLVLTYFWAELYYTSCATRIHNRAAINEMGANVQNHIWTGRKLVEMRSCELLTLF